MSIIEDYAVYILQSGHMRHYHIGRWVQGQWQDAKNWRALEPQARAVVLARAGALIKGGWLCPPDLVALARFSDSPEG